MTDRLSKIDVVQIHRAANEMREQMANEFATFHIRRRKRRVGSQVAALLIIVGLFIGVGWWNFAPGPRGNGGLAKADTDSNHHNIDVATARNANRDSTATLDPASFKSFKLELLDDQELEQLLRESQSNWYVATVDGRVQAFQIPESPRTRKN